MLADVPDETAVLLLDEARELLEAEQLRRLHWRRTDTTRARWIDPLTGRTYTQPEALALLRASLLEARMEAALDSAHVLTTARVLGASIDRDATGRVHLSLTVPAELASTLMPLAASPDALVHALVLLHWRPTVVAASPQRELP